MNGIIYKIYHKDNEDLFYIGSTTDLNRRKAVHKQHCNNVNARHHNFKLYQIIRENGSWDCFQFDIIEEVCCETKEELHKKEDEYITTLKPIMNSNKAIGDKMEYQKQYRIDNKEKKKKYYKDNKEKLTEYHKQYYNDNKERRREYDKQKIKCECGCDIRKDYIFKHRKTKKHINLIQHTDSQILL